MTLRFSSWGRSLGIEVKSPVSVQYAESPVNSSAVIFSGRPVTLNSSGELVALVENKKALGLAKFNKNTYIDETMGAWGMYGSRKGTVIVQAIVDISPNYFVAADGVETVVANYTADLLTAAPMSAVYVVTSGTDAGKLTTILVESETGQNDLTKVGYLLVAPSETNPIARILVSL